MSQPSHFWIHAQENGKQGLGQTVAHCCSQQIAHGSKGEVALMSINDDEWTTNEWMDEMGHTYNGILFSLCKEGHSNTCYHADEPGGCYSN